MVKRSMIMDVQMVSFSFYSLVYSVPQKQLENLPSNQIIIAAFHPHLTVNIPTLPSSIYPLSTSSLLTSHIVVAFVRIVLPSSSRSNEHRAEQTPNTTPSLGSELIIIIVVVVVIVVVVAIIATKYKKYHPILTGIFCSF